MRALGVATLLLASGPVSADEAAVARFDGFVAVVPPVCALAASTRCVDTAFTAVDRDGDDTLALAELQRVRSDLGQWLAARDAELTAMERTYIQLGLWLVDGVGLETLFQSYDVDRNGRLTRAELTADVRLDSRPLAAVALDPNAIDWPAIRDRLGAFAGALPETTR